MNDTWVIGHLDQLYRNLTVIEIFNGTYEELQKELLTLTKKIVKCSPKAKFSYPDRYSYPTKRTDLIYRDNGDIVSYIKEICIIHKEENIINRHCLLAKPLCFKFTEGLDIWISGYFAHGEPQTSFDFWFAQGTASEINADLTTKKITYGLITDYLNSEHRYTQVYSDYIFDQLNGSAFNKNSIQFISQKCNIEESNCLYEGTTYKKDLNEPWVVITFNEINMDVTAGIFNRTQKGIFNLLQHPYKINDMVKKQVFEIFTRRSYTKRSLFYVKNRKLCVFVGYNLPGHYTEIYTEHDCISGNLYMGRMPHLHYLEDAEGFDPRKEGRYSQQPVLENMRMPAWDVFESAASFPKPFIFLAKPLLNARFPQFPNFFTLNNLQACDLNQYKISLDDIKQDVYDNSKKVEIEMWNYLLDHKFNAMDFFSDTTELKSKCVGTWIVIVTSVYKNTFWRIQGDVNDIDRSIAQFKILTAMHMGDKSEKSLSDIKERICNPNAFFPCETEYNRMVESHYLVGGDITFTIISLDCLLKEGKEAFNSYKDSRIPAGIFY